MTESPPVVHSARPTVVGDVCTAIPATGTLPAGIRWRLAESGRQLDANVVHLLSQQRIDMHTEPDLDVLIIVVAGTGILTGSDSALPLAAGSIAWLPHGSARSLDAGDDGLSYLTVHPRRPGMQIGHRPGVTDSP